MTCFWFYIFWISCFIEHIEHERSNDLERSKVTLWHKNGKSIFSLSQNGSMLMSAIGIRICSHSISDLLLKIFLKNRILNSKIGWWPSKINWSVFIETVFQWKDSLNWRIRRILSQNIIFLKMIIYKPVWFLYFLGLGHSSLFVQGLDQGLEDQYADFQWLFPGNNSVIRIGEVYTSGIIWFFRDTKRC